MTHRLFAGPRMRIAVSMTLLLGGANGIACVSERATSTTLDAATCTAPSNTAGATVVFIRSFVFDPAEVHVKAGGSVAWVNCEPTSIPHTSTSDAGQWESGSLSPGAAYVHPFAAVGGFAYHCAIHPGMKATVIVE